MGYLRTLLALTVVFAHSPYGEVFVGGQGAVQLFYVISGFLIGHVLRTNPVYADATRFYANRFLRIYPLYAAVAFGTLIYVALFNRSILHIYHEIPRSAAWFIGLTNVTIVGQDWVMFSGVADGKLRFFTDFTQSQPQLWHALLVPQAWTLGVELMFYLLAPWILRRPGVTWALLALSCAVRLAFWRLGYGSVDPWTYRFFPSELSLFLVGALSNRYALAFWKTRISTQRQPQAAALATACLLALCMAFNTLPLPYLYKMIFLTASCAALLPLAFMFQQRSRFDKAIGELSYPIYIVHVLVIWVIGSAVSKIGLSLEKWSETTLIVVASCLAAHALNRFAAAPIERFRSRLRSGKNPLPMAQDVPAPVAVAGRHEP